tara:strand:- start:3104 stop:3274 length:171 start_codon:yes stop_codon:yes gene_type:complete
MCEKDNRENVGITLGVYKVCHPCIRECIEARMYLLGMEKDEIDLLEEATEDSMGKE